MITQELTEYIRGESAKGKTRGEIRSALLDQGGWDENDLSEAFNTILPAQNVVLPEEKPAEKPSQPAPASASPAVSFASTPMRSYLPPVSFLPSRSAIKSPPLSKAAPSPRSHPWLKFLTIFLIIGGLSFGSWYYRSPIANLWDASVNKISNLSFSFFNLNPDADSKDTVPNVAIEPIASVKNCGTGTTPRLDALSTTDNSDVTLSCLGASAASCANATGVLLDDFFPTVFEIIKSPDSCNFKLSYPADSTLADITGRKLAGQYITCPLSIVKAVDDTDAEFVRFSAPDTINFSRYANQIYFYGILGLFVESNLDVNKIQSLGCSGEYIQTMLASYEEFLKKI